MANSVPKPQDVGLPFFQTISALTTPGTLQTIQSFAAPSGLRLTQLKLSVRQEGAFSVLENDVPIGFGITGPGFDSVITWYPARPVAEGATIDVKFQQRPNSPIVAIGADLMGIITGG